MSIASCAEIVQRADPDRFLAAMAAPPASRGKLFPIYAFNVEVARAPWVTQEPMIAEMRLQWWRDALDEIASGGTVRAHEVTTPLSQAITPAVARVLAEVVDARSWDIHREPFEDEEAFLTYLDRTGASLMWAAAIALGADPSPSDPEAGVEWMFRAVGRATAFTRFLAAVPALQSGGRRPWIYDPDACAMRARDLRVGMAPLGFLRMRRDGLAYAAALEAWQTAPLLRQIERHPRRALEGRVGLSEFRKRLRLLRWS